MNLMYIELKTGYSDDGPAWIGYVKASRSGRTLYFNDHAFRRLEGGNFVDLETGEDYWISGIKKRGTNRHWAGSGSITIDCRAVPEYLALTGRTGLPARQFTVAQIPDRFPIDRVHRLLNEKQDP